MARAGPAELRVPLAEQLDLRLEVTRQRVERYVLESPGTSRSSLAMCESNRSISLFSELRLLSSADPRRRPTGFARMGPLALPRAARTPAADAVAIPSAGDHGTGSEVRAHLVRALEAELVGPYTDREELDRAPSRTYLTGFLVPREDRRADPLTDPDDDTEAEEAEADGDEETGGGEGERPAGEASRRPQVLPASLGLSVLLPPGPATDTVTVTLRCAEYLPFHSEGVKKTRRPSWRRVPHPPYPVVLPLDVAALARGVAIAELAGVTIEGKLGESSTPRPGTRALSVFVVNRRPAGERGRRDETMLFQVSLEVAYAGGFTARPALRRGGDLDDLVAALQYRHVCEYAVGHGVAVEAPTRTGGTRRAP